MLNSRGKGWPRDILERIIAEINTSLRFKVSPHFRNIDIITADINATLPDNFPLITAKFLSLFKPVSVLCKKASAVPDVNANPKEINIEPIMKAGSDFPNMKNKVDISIENFAKIKPVLCPNLSDI